LHHLVKLKFKKGKLFPDSMLEQAVKFINRLDQVFDRAFYEAALAAVEQYQGRKIIAD